MEQNEISNITKKFMALNTNEKQKSIDEYVNFKLEQFGEDFFGSILVEESDPICKWFAIKALGMLSSVKYLNVLINVLIEKDVSFGHTSLHLITASSIGKIGELAIGNVVPLLSSEYSSETQKAVVDTLGEIKSKKGVPYLIEKLENGDYSVALWAGLSLGKIGEGYIEIIDIYKKLPPNIQIIALDALMVMKNIEAINFVITELKDHVEYLNMQKVETTRAFSNFLENLKSNGLITEYNYFMGVINEE